MKSSKLNLSVLVFLAVLVTMVVNCSPVQIVQPDGHPVPDQVLQAFIPTYEMSFKAIYIKSFAKPEGKEFLSEHAYLPWFTEKTPYISPKNLHGLEVRVQVLNPRNVDYQIWVGRSHIMTSPIRNEQHSFKAIYAGKLSRVEKTISLPLDAKSTGYVRITLRTDDGHTFYTTPEAKYKIGGFRTP